MGEHYAFYVLKVLEFCFCAVLKKKYVNIKVVFLTKTSVGLFRLNCRVGTLEYVNDFRVTV